MKWREVDFVQICDWVQSKKVVERDPRDTKESLILPPGIHEGECFKLSDDSFIYSKSEWSGPYSPETPDVDAEPPRWWIGEIGD